MRRAMMVLALIQFFFLQLCSVAQDSNSLGEIARRQRQSGDNVAHPKVIDTGGYRRNTPPPIQKSISPFQVFAWLAGGMPSDFLAKEVRSRGLTFYADNEFIEKAKNAGAESDLAEELQKASQTAAQTELGDSEATRNMIQVAISMKADEYRSAQRQIRAMLRADNQNADLYFALGNLYHRTEDWDSAAAAFAHAVQLAPDFAYAWGQLSLMYYHLEDAPEARTAAEAMLRLQPDTGDGFSYLGLSKQLAGDYDGALDDLHRANIVEPKHGAIYFYDMGLVYTARKQWPTAVSAYEKAVAIGPPRWYFYNNLGIALGKVNRVDDAVAAFEKAKEMEPSRPEPRQSFGAVLCNAGRSEQAVKEFRELLDLVPDWNMARPCLYRSLTRLGRTEEAKQVMEDYKKYSPDHTAW